jgi:hypothetical protein
MVMQKNLLLIITGIFSVFLFIGCQQQQEEVFMDEQPMDRRVGEIKSLGSNVAVNQGTHILELDDGETILLRSIVINLDDEKYKKKIVEVQGVLDYTKDGKQIMTVSNIDILDDSEEEKASEPAWVVFSSTGLEFSLTYRNDLEIKDSGNEVSFIREFSEDEDPESEDAKLIQHIFSVKRSTLGEDGLTEYLGLSDDSSATLLAESMSKSKVGEQSLDAIKKTGSEKGITKYYVDGGAHVYLIDIDSGNDEKSLSDQNIFFEMLNTFRISDSDLELSIDSPVLDAETIDEDDTASSTSSGITFDSDMEVSLPSEPVTEPEPEPEELDVSTDDFSSYESDSFKFAFDYPSNWFFEGKSSSEEGVLRTYELGDKPLDESEGFASLDVISGSMPSGNKLIVNGAAIIEVSENGQIAYYVDGAGSRVYKVSGSSSQADDLLKIASSVEDL